MWIFLSVLVVVVGFVVRLFRLDPIFECLVAVATAPGLDYRASAEHSRFGLVGRSPRLTTTSSDINDGNKSRYSSLFTTLVKKASNEQALAPRSSSPSSSSSEALNIRAPAPLPVSACLCDRTGGGKGVQDDEERKLRHELGIFQTRLLFTGQAGLLSSNACVSGRVCPLYYLAAGHDSGTGKFSNSSGELDKHDPDAQDEEPSMCRLELIAGILVQETSEDVGGVGLESQYN
ncbi:hypothetical protein B0O80DRAFT_429270 [Mortierella sp. GBAus27b]|nr:hypothetical protein B0O80DRAFT_429270 [Mortierella sp. GBAus27b]